MVRSRQSGFSLIEITLVMAISSILFLIVFRGFSATRAQAQFSSGVEQLKEATLGKRAEALTNINIQPTNPGTNTGSTAFGRILTFTAGSGTILVQTLVTANVADPPANQRVDPDPANEESYDMKWGIVYRPPAGSPLTVSVAFTHSLLDNSLQTVVFAPATSLPSTYDKFLAGAGGAGLQSLAFADPDGRTAYIDINPTNGAITRRFQ